MKMKQIIQIIFTYFDKNEIFWSIFWHFELNIHGIFRLKKSNVFPTPSNNDLLNIPIFGSQLIFLQKVHSDYNINWHTNWMVEAVKIFSSLVELTIIDSYLVSFGKLAFIHFFWSFTWKQSIFCDSHEWFYCNLGFLLLIDFMARFKSIWISFKIQIFEIKPVLIFKWCLFFGKLNVSNS